MSDFRVIDHRGEDESGSGCRSGGCGSCGGGCGTGSIPNSGYNTELAFNPGDVVISLLTGEKMMIVLNSGIDRFDYLVRTPSYEIVPMMEFEIKAETDKQDLDSLKREFLDDGTKIIEDENGNKVVVKDGKIIGAQG